MAIAACSAPLAAQDFRIDTAIRGNGPRPDGGFFFRYLTPAIEGTTVVFRSKGIRNAINDSVWSLRLETGLFTQLASLDTAVPGGTGRFTSFESGPPLIRDGTVLFAGHDASTGVFTGGLYAVPATGGPIRKVVDHTTADPTGGGAFTAFSQAAPGGFSLSAGRVVFEASNAANQPGIYGAGTDGSDLVRLADGIHPVHPGSAFPVVFFANPAISGDNVAFWGRGTTDPGSGFNAIYTTRPAGPSGLLPDGSPAYQEILTSDTPLPGGPTTKFHTRIDVPSLQVDGATLYFKASDSVSGYSGIFSMPVGGGTIRKLVASDDSLPGLKKLDPGGSFAGCSAASGSVAFRAVDQDGQDALFIWANGGIRRVAGSGDMLNGQAVRSVETPGSASLSGDRLVFYAALIVTGPGQSDEGMFVAVPVTRPVVVNTVSNAASYAGGPIAPGELIAAFGDGMGPDLLAATTVDSSGRFPSSFAGTRIFVNGTPAPLIYASATHCGAVVPYSIGIGSTATLTVEYQGMTSNPVPLPVVAVAPGLFAMDSSGAGQGAILNQDGSLNGPENPAASGEVMVLFGTGAGLVNPPAVDGQVSAPGAFDPGIPVAVTLGGVAAKILYFGPAPGLVSGAFQLNITVPPGLPAGNTPVVVSLGASQSQPRLTAALR